MSTINVISPNLSSYWFQHQKNALPPLKVYPGCARRPETRHGKWEGTSSQRNFLLHSHTEMSVEEILEEVKRHSAQWVLDRGRSSVPKHHASLQNPAKGWPSSPYRNQRHSRPDFWTLRLNRALDCITQKKNYRVRFNPDHRAEVFCGKGLSGRYQGLNFFSYFI